MDWALQLKLRPRAARSFQLGIGKEHLRSAASSSPLGSSSSPIIGIDTAHSLLIDPIPRPPFQQFRQQQSFCSNRVTSLCLAVSCPSARPAMHALKTCASTAIRHASRRGYASVSSASAYSKSIPNLRINSETKVIFQGFTGKLSIAYSQSGSY